MKKNLFLFLMLTSLSFSLDAQVVNPISAPFLNWEQSPYISYNLKTSHDKGYHDGINFIMNSQTAYAISPAGAWEVYVGLNNVLIYKATMYNAFDQIGLIDSLEDMKSNIYSSSNYLSNQIYWDGFVEAIDDYLFWGIFM